MKCFVIIIVMCLTLTLCYYIYYLNFVSCDAGVYMEMLKEMCQQSNCLHSATKNGEGKLPLHDVCPEICRLDYKIQCLGFHYSKDDVFGLVHNENSTKNMVLKTVNDDENDTEAYWNQSISTPPSLEELQSMVNATKSALLGTSTDANLTYFNASQLQFKLSDLEYHRKLWKFLNDHEFFTAYLFHKFNFFPKLLGICEAFYVSEYAAPLNLFYIGFYIRERIEKALSLLKLLYKLQTSWVEHIHLCDMKPEHFGWVGQNALFLDLDSVVSDSALMSIMLNTPECSNDEDCSYFDCLGKCLSNNTCSFQRMNANVQVLCSKIFLGYIGSFQIPFRGLLNYFFISSNLYYLLQRCVQDPSIEFHVLEEALNKELLSYSSQHEL